MLSTIAPSAIARSATVRSLQALSFSPARSNLQRIRASASSFTCNSLSITLFKPSNFSPPSNLIGRTFRHYSTPSIAESILGSPLSKPTESLLSLNEISEPTSALSTAEITEAISQLTLKREDPEAKLKLKLSQAKNSDSNTLISFEFSDFAHVDLESAHNLLFSILLCSFTRNKGHNLCIQSQIVNSDLETESLTLKTYKCPLKYTPIVREHSLSITHSIIDELQRAEEYSASGCKMRITLFSDSHFDYFDV